MTHPDYDEHKKRIMNREERKVRNSPDLVADAAMEIARILSQKGFTFHEAKSVLYQAGGIIERQCVTTPFDPPPLGRQDDPRPDS